MALQIGTRTLPLQGFARLGEMRRSQLSELSDAELQQRMDLDGYLYLPGLIPREAVLAGQRSIVSGLSAASDNPIFDEARGERALLPGRERSSPPVGWLQESGEVMRVLEGQELFGVFGRLYGGPASTFDYKWFRAIGEGAGSPFHFDGIYMSRAHKDGAAAAAAGELVGRRQHTAWVPWCDVPVGESGIVVVEGSHRLAGFAGLRRTLGTIDVNYTDIAPPFSFDDPLEVLAYGPPPPPPPPPLPPVLADRPRLQHFGRVLGAACLTPSRCRAGPADPAARLLTANFSAGDVVLFTMFTLHGSSTNLARPAGGLPRLRLSCDIRFQPKGDPIDKRHTADGRICRGIDEANRHPGPHRPLRQALQEWGLSVAPIAPPVLPAPKL